MNVLVVVDGTYFRTKDKAVYSQGVYGYSFFKRYLTVFKEVYVMARIKDVTSVPEGLKLANGERVSFLALPSYKGPIQYMSKRFKVKKLTKELIKDFECCILRVPSATAQGVFSIINKQMPTALEVVVDPWEYFAPNTITKWYRPFVRVYWTLQLKKMCRKADGVSYVTSSYLQGKYPCEAFKEKPGYFTASYSSVEIKDGSIAEPRVYEERKGTFHFVHAAVSFTTEGKGHKILMQALKQVVDAGYDADVTFIGDGPLRSNFEDYAKELGIQDRVIFVGRLPGAEAVRKQMMKADVFVFPTRAEGLPRVLIEAMAEGLPCISTPVCGIPEILEKEWMFPYDDIKGFSACMIKCINNPEILTEQSKRNVIVAKKFVNSTLAGERNKFYETLSEITREGR